mgnify:CR=1 FL=1
MTGHLGRGLGPLRRLGPLGAGDLPPGYADSMIVPVEPLPAERYYADWLDEIQAHLYYPWASDDRFGEGDEDTLAASATASLVVGFTIPPTHIGVWYSWAQNTGTPGDFANIRWRLYANGVPLRDHYSVQGQVSSLLNPEWLYAPIPPGSRVAVLADNLSASAISNVGCRIRGWHWPMIGRREA